MRTDIVKQAALVAAFVGSVAVAGLAGQATAGPASSHQGPSTRDVVEPVWLAVLNADTQFDSAARIELVRAATAKTPADRGRLRDAAAKKLDIAIKHLRRIPTPLPRVLNSAFARARVANLRALGARARRSLTKTNGLGDARRATEAAVRETDLLLDYLTLTVVRITARFEFPVTTYVAETFSPYDGRGYSWSNTNDCGDFSFQRRIASWSHPDSELPGACAREDVHPATVTVVVKRRGVTCVGRYDRGSAAGVEFSPAVDPCTVR